MHYDADQLNTVSTSFYAVNKKSLKTVVQEMYLVSTTGQSVLLRVTRYLLTTSNTSVSTLSHCASGR